MAIVLLLLIGWLIVAGLPTLIGMALAYTFGIRYLHYTLGVLAVLWAIFAVASAWTTSSIEMEHKWPIYQVDSVKEI